MFFFEFSSSTHSFHFPFSTKTHSQHLALAVRVEGLHGMIVMMVHPAFGDPQSNLLPKGKSWNSEWSM